MAEPREPRTRTVTWPDPGTYTDPIRRLSGLEFMRSFARGELPTPPFAALLGMRIVSVEPGAVAFEFEPAEFTYSPLGTVHGGILTTLLDTVMGCSFHTTLPAGVGYTTLELKVNFLRTVTVATGILLAEGRVIHSGSRVATVEGQMFDRQRRLHAHATSTLLILRPDPR
jgi:uncharacterized protein (TIGR00369 family)